ncbi:UNVERIFIED_CONTAM: hypothetical protein FKN15_020123, partial [Acipenser sinensis]
LSLSLSEYVRSHWQLDSFFGYQFLNGCNPYVIRQCKTPPPNLAVTPEMVQPFLPACTSLPQEMERGTIFLADYEILEGVPANCVNGRPQHLAAPLCLLYRNQQGELLPIAIQLKQTPGPHNPVFLPSDSEADWLLAKIWVRNSDFQCHQLVSHYLKTHMLGEAYCVATLRHLPGAHPLHKGSIVKHITISLSPSLSLFLSLFLSLSRQSISCGLDGVTALIHRAMQRLRYSALCLPEDLRERGVDSLDNNYFARDGLRVWGAIHRFVEGLLQFFYPSDSAVQQDSELQSWITDLFHHAFLGLQQTGFPQTFQNRAELVQFVTMVIFSCSAQHAAVNFSQLDFDLWMPNCPASLRQPPPSSKGSRTLPDLLHPVVFVEGLLQFFYPSDSAVQQDSELQSWITDLFHHAFLGLQQTGFPQTFQNRAELVQFVTMVIFSCSAQHAAVNFSQLDFDLWMPNCPASLRQPPPSSKGSRTLPDLLHHLPEVNSTCSVLLTLAMLSQPSSDYIPLGFYRDPPFIEETPRNLILEFQADLRNLGSEIDDRNAGLELPYRYLRPDLIENSVSI